jgi:hypothetical protein
MYERTYHKTVLKADGKEQKKKTSFNWKLVLRLAIGAVVIVGLVLLIRLPRVQVRHIEVVGANVVDPGDVTEFVNQQLQGKTLFILPKSSIFLISEHGLEKKIAKAFPRIQTVSVQRSNFSTLTISMTEYQGVYLWCTDEATCDFMDQNGIAFAPAPYFSGNAYPKIFIGAVHGLPYQVLSSGQVAAVALIMDRLTTIGITPEEFHFTSEHELDVDFNHDGQQAQLFFDPTIDTKQALIALYTGLRTNPLATEYRDQSKVLQYIDLRFANRVVYKFQ